MNDAALEKLITEKMKEIPEYLKGFDEVCQQAIDNAIDSKDFFTFTFNDITMTAGRHSSVSGLKRIFDERWKNVQEKDNENS